MAEVGQVHEPVRAPSPLRVLVMVGATADWYQASAAKDLQHRVVERILAVMGSWKTRPGVRFLSSLDDDLLMAGVARTGAECSMYMLFDVDEMDTVASMVDDFRHGDPALHTYFVIKALVGRPLWLIE